MFDAEIDLRSVDLDAYCARVGYDGPREPTFAALEALHRLHPAAIAFETFDARLGLGIDLNAHAVDAKLIDKQRGGYCFEQNTLFLRALRSLGFEADPLIARSMWGRAPGEFHPRTHMAIRVHIEGRTWLADVGFGGCMMTAPIRMDCFDPQATRHEAARLSPIGNELRLERFLAEKWTPVCDIVPEPQRAADLMAANWVICRHPGSPFLQRLVVSRTFDDARFVLVDARLTTRRKGTPSEHRTLSEAELAVCLNEVFGLEVLDEWGSLLAQIAQAAR